MAVSIEELISKQEEIKQKKKELFDLTTSVGTITVKKVSPSLALEVSGMDGEDSDRYLVLNAVVSPDLKDSRLLKAYGCLEPTDILDKIFDHGEIVAISRKIMELSGFGKEIHSEVHKEAKN